nr:hypothetical protein [uncultured Butyrivibrio sp.]
MESKKTGVTTNGKIENINNIGSVKCDCRKCFHSKKIYGGVYCKYYDKINPRKQKCIRFCQKEHYKPIDRTKPIIAKELTSYEPSFPWETPIMGVKRTK